MKKERISQILFDHKKYLQNLGGCRADLREADLREANLRGANLSGAYLRRADLRKADLIGADLTRADLSGAKLREADLREANLSGAYLIGADLTGANLRGANLTSANLSGADLLGADFDFSCLPIWCGSLSAKFDDKQIKQFMYHIVKAGLFSPNVSDRIKAELEKLIPLANEFHRAIECGIIESKSP